MKKSLFILLWVGLLFGGDYQVNKALTLKKIRTYCRACHAVDNLRFIKSDDDQELWNTIFTEKSPKSGELWVTKIIETLNWPPGEPPSFDTPMSDNGDWMPKGFKRLSLAEDFTEEKPTRLIMLETLSAGP